MIVKLEFSSKYLFFTSLASVFLFGLIAYFIIVWPEKFHLYAKEDGPIESLGAVFFGFSSVLFCFSAFKYRKYQESDSFLRLLPTLAWAMLAFLAFGEEISWGQRIFGFETPMGLQVENYHQNEGLLKNMQNETNLHNMGIFYEFIGTWRLTMGLLILIGIVYPLSSMIPFIRKIYQDFSIPVCPIYYISLSISGFVIQHYLKPYAYFPNDTSETYEMILALLFFLFSLHCYRKPNEVFLKTGSAV